MKLRNIALFVKDRHVKRLERRRGITFDRLLHNPSLFEAYRSFIFGIARAMPRTGVLLGALRSGSQLPRWRYADRVRKQRGGDAPGFGPARPYRPRQWAYMEATLRSKICATCFRATRKRTGPAPWVACAGCRGAVGAAWMPRASALARYRLTDAQLAAAAPGKTVRMLRGHRWVAIRRVLRSDALAAWADAWAGDAARAAKAAARSRKKKRRRRRVAAACANGVLGDGNFCRHAPPGVARVSISRKERLVCRMVAIRPSYFSYEGV